MKEAERKYLPQEEGEEDNIYYNRLTRSVLFGAYSRTVKSLSAIPFMTAMTVADLPTELEYLLSEADGDEEALHPFVKRLLEDLINFGKCHILVEYPVLEEELSLGEEQEQNIRPYFSRINPLKLINWTYKTVGSKKQLTSIRLFEDVDVVDPADQWNVKPVQQIRNITPGFTQIFQNSDSDGKETGYTQLGDDIPNSLDKIGLVTVYANKQGYMQSAPLLEELAWLNIRHYQKVSDLDNIEHVTSIPMAYALGIEDGEMDKVTFAAHTLLKSTNPEVKIGYLEHQGKAIPAQQNSIQQLEQRMAAMGADMLTPRGTSTRETGIAKTIDNTKATSILQESVEALELGLEKAFTLAGEWMDVDASGTQVNIGDKISLTVDANLVANLIGLMQSKNLSPEDLTQEMQKRGMLSESTNLTSGIEDQVTDTPQIGDDVAVLDDASD